LEILKEKNNFAERFKNFIEILKITSNAAKNFDILATTIIWTFYIIILMVQQNYFSDLYSAKILDLSAKPFFPCR